MKGPRRSASRKEVMHGQMYVVEVLTPREARHPFPLVLIHGAAQTATNWMAHPMGGMASRNCAAARSLNESARLSQSPTRPSAPNWNRRANGWCEAGAAASRF
jgi:hypothetical protein